MFNKVFLVGRLGADPELRYTAQGTEVCTFRIVTSETWKDKDGGKQEKSEWHTIIAWRNLGKICGEYLTKGMLVCIEGKITTRQWEDKQGVKRYTTEIVASEMKMLGGGKPKEQQQAQPNAAPPAQDDSDIPF